jgi:hypothetical protein
MEPTLLPTIPLATMVTEIPVMTMALLLLPPLLLELVSVTEFQVVTARPCQNQN